MPALSKRNSISNIEKSASVARTRKASPRLVKEAQEPPRLVIQEDGRILFASPQLVDGPITDISAKDILYFSSPEDAMSDRPSMKLRDGQDPWTAAIMDGEHELQISGKGKKIALAFDRIKLPDGRQYLVASLTGQKKKSADTTNPVDLKNFVSKIAKKPKPARAKSSAQDRDLSVFLNMTHDLTVLMKRDGSLIEANATFLDNLGYDKDEISKINFIDIIHPDDRAHIRTTFKSLMQDDTADGQLIAFECRVLTRAQEPRWLEWRQKRIGQKIYAVCRDLTDIKEHETSLLRHQQQLSEAQAIGHMGHWRWQSGEDAISFSDEIYRIFDLTAEEFQPTIDSVNSRMHRRDRGRMGQALQRAMIERKNYEMEFRVIRPDNSIRFILLQGRCEMDEDGDVSALFGIMQDMTERVQHERELRDAKENAERAYAAKSQFLANMSHELRTPLNAIIGFSEMMQRQLLGPIGTEKYLDYIENIRVSGEHLLDLISDILDMSKIEAGRYDLDLEEFNLLKVLRLACHMIEGRALDAQVRIVGEVTEDEYCDVVADRRAVMQIMLNLLSNAVKFTEPGGEVRIEYKSENDMAFIRVTDTGIGIPASKLRYVTEPFEQAANHFTRNHEGSGLGLAITKELIELHGGTMTIDSTVGIGTSVAFTLPHDCQNKKSLN